MTVEGGSQAPTQARPRAAADVEAFLARFDRLRKRVVMQTWAIAGLAVVLAGVLPFARPVFFYYAINPEKKVMLLTGLDRANMTNKAVLSWATISITELMTMGFGDIDKRVAKQRSRFTDSGWEAYNKAFVEMKIGEKFKENQLVLTTVPSDTPVILGQGPNRDKTYQWNVEMPIIMTYATNNNKMERKAGIVNLAIVRVPIEQNSAGIAIQNWVVK